MKPIHALLTALAFSALTPAMADEMNEPWAERAISGHVDQSTLKGRLDRETLDALRDKGETLFGA